MATTLVDVVLANAIEASSASMSKSCASKNTSGALHSMKALVQVPSGVQPGQEMTVTLGEQEFLVEVPPGCESGSMIEVVLPSFEAPMHSTVIVENTVDVEVPPGCGAGDELMVTTDSGSFAFTVPDDYVAGSPVIVAVPPALEADDDALADSYTPRAGGDEPRTRHPYPVFEDETSAAQAPAHSTPNRRSKRLTTEAACVEHDKPVPHVFEPQCKFWVNLEVEVLRTDGRRTCATIQATNYSSGTYTIKTHDGRMKYFVEEEDLAHLWAGKYRTGDAVRVRFGQRERDARIAGHDDEDGTYSVIFADGDIVDQIRRTRITQQASLEMG